jgi:hypothetical protein
MPITGLWSPWVYPTKQGSMNNFFCLFCREMFGPYLSIGPWIIITILYTVPGCSTGLIKHMLAVYNGMSALTK